MNNQPWPPSQPPYGPQPHNQPQWLPQQFNGQPPSNQPQPNRLPMPGYHPPSPPMQYHATPQPNYTPPPQFRPVLEPPAKKSFFDKKVAVPLWAIILTLLVLIGLAENMGSKFASAGTNQNTSGSPTLNSSYAASTATTHSGTQTRPTAVPTQAPTHTPRWKVTQTFTGNGSKKTAVFHVGDDWKILWSCNPSSSFGSEYNLIVDVNNSDTTSLDPGAINTLCKTGNTSDITEEHQGGDVYLDITSESFWKIQVEELQ